MDYADIIGFPNPFVHCEISLLRMVKAEPAFDINRVVRRAVFASAGAGEKNGCKYPTKLII